MGAFNPRIDDDRSWMKDAACRGMDVSVFFPEELRSGTGPTARRAKAVCESCPVRVQCWNYSVEEEHGIWAGQSARDRRLYRRARNKAMRSAS